MNSTNINDTAAVKVLLDQLRASRVWQDTLNAGSSNDSPECPIEPDQSPACPLGDGQGKSATTTDPFDVVPPASVASLLSQLRTSSTAIDTPSSSKTRATHWLPRNIPPPLQDLPSTHSEDQTPQLTSTHVQDVRFMSFQQALPRLTELAGDPEFLTAISRLRQEQDALEQQLWEERQAVQKKHEDKVKVARTKATLIGAGLSKHEADMINDAYRRDLQRFDKERVSLAWDALIQKQQETMEALGVPTMFAATSQADCQKQRRVVQVLEGL